MHCECGWAQDDAPWYAHHHHHEIQQLKRRMDKMSDQQAEINADVAELQAANTNIVAEIAALQAANPALDLTGLKAAADQLSAIAPPADGSTPNA